MEIEELFGLPAHPLVVHAAYCFPLPPSRRLSARRCPAPVGTMPRSRSPWRSPPCWRSASRRLRANRSRRHVDETELVEQHAGQGERVLPWAIGVVVVAGAVMAIPLLERRRPAVSAKHVTAVVVAASLLVGAGAIWTVAEVGHSGAKATWNDVGTEEGD